MVFVKVQKTNAYFKRYQVQYRRRREGKTDYQARRALIMQDNNKYNTPKYRFVVRRTNKRIICQVAYSTLQGDRVVSAADSMELQRYGVPIGFTNYSAAYCTGLLCARRLLSTLKMDSMYEGVVEATGEDSQIEENEDRRPFKAVLDVGLVRTTAGNRVFGAMKGACDGGLNIPHSEKRFPGYNAEKGALDASVHRARIFGQHVADYMRSMKEEDDTKYRAHFSKFIKHDISPDSLEGMYKKAHASIRASPAIKPKAKRNVKSRRDGEYIVSSNGAKYPQPRRLTLAQRKERVAAKIQAAVEAASSA